MTVKVRVVAPVQRGAATYSAGEIISATTEEVAAWEGSVERVEEPKKKD